MVHESPTFELALVGNLAAHQFTAFIPDEQGGRAAEHTFTWNSDSTALAMDVRALAEAAISGHPPEDNLHVTFGQRLFTTVFAGAVGDLWRTRAAALRTRRQALHLLIRIDPSYCTASAQPSLGVSARWA